jgi:CHASE2 domain-containing sensor protein
MINIESHEYAARRFQAEQAVGLMDRKMRIKLGWHAKDGLIKAMTKVAIDNGLLFGHQPFHPPPRRWSLEGMLSRLAVYWKAQKLVLASRGRPNIPNGTEVPDLSEATFSVKRSGARGLVIVLILALLVGLTGFGAPFETGVQIGRDALRRTAVSGDIVIIAKDDRSAKLYGGMPWARRYDAQLVDCLREMGAKRIVYNVIMADPSNKVDDSLLAAAFERAKGLVWLGTLRGDAEAFGSTSITPMPLFRDKTRQAHGNTWYGVFGEVHHIPGNVVVDGVEHPSQADVLANVEATKKALRPDYAIDYKSIKTISATSVMRGEINSNVVSGKSILIISNSLSKNDSVPFVGRGAAHIGYSWVIAAETIKNGVAARLGYWIPLAIVALLGLWCIMQRSLLRRLPILIGGLALLTALVLGGDQLGYHFEIVPAGLAWLLFGVRQCLRGEVVAMTTLHPVSKLPRLGHLAMVRDCKQSTAVAVRILNYDELMEMGNRPLFEQYQLDRSIAARINVIAPDCIVHQGEDGLFVFLIAPDSVCNPDHVGEQIRALFCMQLVSLRELMNVEVAVGINANLQQDLTVRVAVAVDRARPIQFTGLHAV